MDHVSLQKRESAQDQCLVLDLARPSSSRTGYTATVPTGWGLSAASVRPCTSSSTAVFATSVTGTIAWGDATAYPPTTANVDVVVGVTLEAGVIATYVFSAQNIALPYGC